MILKYLVPIIIIYNDIYNDNDNESNHIIHIYGNEDNGIVIISFNNNINTNTVFDRDIL